MNTAIRGGANMHFQDLKAKAEAGDVVSQGLLGIAFLYGSDAPKDHAAALRWLSAAVNRGAARPTLHLGRMHEEGWGVPVDYLAAKTLYQRSAARGEWLAFIHLARM